MKVIAFTGGRFFVRADISSTGSLPMLKSPFSERRAVKDVCHEFLC